MSLDISSLDHSAVAGRLRAAGCVFAEDEAGLLIATATGPEELAVMVGRRVAGEPLEHVLGWAEFCGLRISVGPGVFVPRRRTEFLVEQAVSLAHDGAVVVDLCCGSGAVGAAVLAHRPSIELHAVDIDPEAIQYARRNLPHGHVYRGDLYTPLPEGLRGRVDVLVASTPYVPTGAIGLLPPEARLHEPHLALDGGADGLDIVRRVTAAAPDWLAPGAHLLLETSAGQAAAAVTAVTRSGLIPHVAGCDELDATVVTGAVATARPV
ncbi:putative protein N(5)-glutamine methyltransferase [Acrocarpospora catenulata]|uniref:putative protein N(5)-glutamine methyltransferase n=1 Tax=Acrocarpospora catenulata TaxID=2836182 RepID=UPI001BDA4418|nr:putative protein N(5)-glutamine methyltransferase [Acrocarpospora catenulata]